ncbi:large-conductance mechanosensitive channel protein MscL [Streptococcaceae bacterium ESL0729]|nr:large-conductance mechanosensitive channel protein MscL [Streptococcaceae bacterium ESL0729]
MFKSFAKEFKDFIMKGNVLDLAVGVIIGGAFTAIVSSLTTNLITPLLGIFLPSKSAFDSLTFKVGGATFGIGAFINSVITFLITAFVVFILVKIVNATLSAGKKEEEDTTAAPTVDPQIELLTEIRDLLKKEEALHGHRPGRRK